MYYMLYMYNIYIYIYIYIYISENIIEDCLKLINNHGLLTRVIDKKAAISMSLWFPSICNISHPSDNFLQCQGLLENIIHNKLTCVRLFAMFSLSCHNILHHYLYIAEALVSTMFQQFSIFLKELVSSTVEFNLFNKV